MYSEGWSEIRECNKKAEELAIIKKIAMIAIGASILIAVSAELAFIIVGQF